MKYYVYLLTSNLLDKKYKVIIYDQNKKKLKTIHFAQKGYEDYTIHQSDDSLRDQLATSSSQQRKENYIKRHVKNEDFDDIMSKGFWALNILWNKKNIKQSKSDIEKRYDIIFLN